jgi:hypothetical protein
MVHLSKVADLNLGADWLHETQEIDDESVKANNIKLHLVKAILMLSVLSKDLNINVWDALSDDSLSDF